MMASTNVMGFRWLEHICCFTENRHPRVLLAVGILLLHFRGKQRILCMLIIALPSVMQGEMQ